MEACAEASPHIVEAASVPPETTLASSSSDQTVEATEVIKGIQTILAPNDGHASPSAEASSSTFEAADHDATVAVEVVEFSDEIFLPTDKGDASAASQAPINYSDVDVFSPNEATVMDIVHIMAATKASL